LSKSLENVLKVYKKEFRTYIERVCTTGRKLMVKGELLEILERLEQENGNELSKIEDVVRHFTESVCLSCDVFVEMREKIGYTQYFRFNLKENIYEQITSVEYLKAKEVYRDPEFTNDQLTLNFKTFYDKFPSVREAKNIGKGVEYLNRYLSSNMFTNPQKMSQALFDFLFVHKHGDEQLILNDNIHNPEELNLKIDKAMKYLHSKPADEPYSDLKRDLQKFGFEQGLGNSAGRILESLEQLEALLQTPDHLVLKEFLSRIPMVYNIAIISPHGYFGQEGVLGKPDTGGQVVYILDQVKALEKELNESLKLAGVKSNPKIIILTRLIHNADDTTCNKRLEKVNNTKNVWILRVPFREHNRNVTDNWISRFEIWPYLEEFADDSAGKLIEEFGTRPDLIIGNYSDGNLVATILAKKFGVTQCNIAHALEKSKYLYSALYWQDMDDHYHFSSQFTADLLAMNSADFIITSTYQEIAGREDSIGQYESYTNFTMPGLYRVAGGINLFHPKFNILPPGVNTKLFFPYTKTRNRSKKIKDEIYKRFFGDHDSSDGIGKLKNPDLPPIFSMARLDKIKNIASLVKWFGEHSELQKYANLIIVAGKIDIKSTTDKEEQDQIELMHKVTDSFNLLDKIRWLPGDGDRKRVPEYYRVIADKKGVFVQPALFEGFGLTVIEAMRSGLPTFATQYGGPLEIIEEGRSGFHIDPVNGQDSVKKIINFFKKCKKDKDYWDKISKGGIKRVDTAFNWELYSKNLLSLAKIYGFWKYTTNLDMSEMNAYLDLLYHMLYKPKAKKILELHEQRIA
jgi:sucrose synthase